MPLPNFAQKITQQCVSFFIFSDKTLNSKIVWSKQKKKIVFEEFTQKERGDTWATKLSDNPFYLAVDIFITVIAVFAICLPFWLPEFFGALLNPVNAIRLRAAVNVWFLFSAYLDTKSKGTPIIFSSITMIHPNTIINLGLPALFAMELVISPEKSDLLFYGEVSQGNGFDPLVGEEARAARAVSVVGRSAMGIEGTARIARIAKVAGMKVKASAAILKVNRQLATLTQSCPEETKTEDAITQGLILIAIFLLILIGSDLQTPTSFQTANEYGMFFLWFMIGLMTTSYLMKSTIKRAIFVPIDMVIERIIAKIESSARLRFLLETFSKDAGRHSVIEAIGWQAVNFADAIRLSPDLFEQQLRGNLQQGRFPQTMVTTDLIGCTKWMSTLSPEEAMAVLNKDYFPLLIDSIKYGHDPIQRFVDEVEPETAINFVKFVGDAALLSKELGKEDEIVRNTFTSLWKTRKILKGTRFCIHTEEINQVVINGGMDIQQPDIMGPGVNTLFRIIDLNKKYGTTLILTEETYQHLSQELQAQLMFIDSVTPEGGVQRINLYTPSFIPIITKKGTFAGKIPRRHRLKIKQLTDDFKKHYLVGDFAEATNLLSSIEGDKRLRTFMPWIGYVQKYLKANPTPPKEWDVLGRAMSNKAGD